MGSNADGAYGCRSVQKSSKGERSPLLQCANLHNLRFVRCLPSYLTNCVVTKTVIEAPHKMYAGMAHVSFDDGSFEFGYGVTLKSTYAHLFAANMMAFARAPEGKHHPGPWRAAQGGYGYDIEVELAVPSGQALPGQLSEKDTIWLIAALLRLANYVHLTVPIISDVAFDAASENKRTPLLQPFEIEPRIFRAIGDNVASLKAKDLLWVKSVWPRTAELMRTCPSLSLALRAADACTVQGRPASALLMVWGALEQLFSPSSGELRFRVSAYIAAYLEPISEKRFELFKLLYKLYNERSQAAHTAKEANTETLVQSFVILRNALVKMIDEGEVPTQAKLQQRLFCGDDQ